MGWWPATRALVVHKMGVDMASRGLHLATRGLLLPHMGFNSSFND